MRSEIVVVMTKYQTLTGNRIRTTSLVISFPQNEFHTVKLRFWWETDLPSENKTDQRSIFPNPFFNLFIKTLSVELTPTPNPLMYDKRVFCWEMRSFCFLGSVSVWIFCDRFLTLRTNPPTVNRTHKGYFPSLNSMKFLNLIISHRPQWTSLRSDPSSYIGHRIYWLLVCPSLRTPQQLQTSH